MKFNSILLVLPILTVLMFDLGLSLRVSDFVNIFKKPKAMMAGLAGQYMLHNYPFKSYLEEIIG